MSIDDGGRWCQLVGASEWTGKSIEVIECVAQGASHIGAKCLKIWKGTTYTMSRLTAKPKMFFDCERKRRWSEKTC